MRKRLLSMLLCAALALGLGMTMGTDATGAGPLTDAQITKKLNDYYSAVGGLYWNGQKKPDEMKANKDNYKYGTTSSSCPGPKNSHNNLSNYDSSICRSNKFDSEIYYSDSQCSAFTSYLAYVLFGHDTAELRNTNNGENYTKSTSVPSSFRPGDIIRYMNNRHSVIVVESTGNTLTVLECNISGLCQIGRRENISISTVQSGFSYVITPNSNLRSNGASLSAPTGLTVSYINREEATVSWNHVSGATGYEVQYKRDGIDWTNDSDYTGGTSYRSSQMRHLIYYFRVRAVGSGDKSPYTEIQYDNRNPYQKWQDLYGDGNLRISCAWFAWQETLNKLGVVLPAWGNAGTWLTSAANAGYATGSTAAPNSIAVWTGGTGGYGHVAYVTAVNGSQMTVDEAGRTTDESAATDGVVRGRVTSNVVGSVMWNNYTLAGFIYPGGSSPAPVTPPAAPGDIAVSWSETEKWAANISWTPSDGATYYEVQYRTDKTGGQWKSDPDYKDNTKTAYMSDSLRDYATYEYQLRAVNAGGASEWKKFTLYKTVSVTLNANGGTVSPTSRSYTYDNTNGTPAPYGDLPTPQYSGYRFLGWYTAKSGGTKISASTKVSTAKNHSLYAHWEKIPTYTVTFNSNGGSAVTTQTVESGKTATKPTDPTKTGCTFAGWYTDSACTKEFDFKTAITKNLTLYAKWTENPAFTISGGFGEGNSLIATVTAPAGAVLIAACYDANGRQVDIRTIQIKKACTDKDISTGLSRTSGYTYKLMLVDGGSYAPLCKAWTKKA